MIYMLDTADINEIKVAMDLYPIVGVTTNPTIIAREKRNYFEVVKKIREVIGNQMMIHIQVLSESAADMIEEAKIIKEEIGGNLYIKIPVTQQGIKAIKTLVKEGYNITATAIFTSQQALMAATAGAEYLAPYINRVDNICGNGALVVNEIARLLEVSGNFKAKVLGASFRNVKQVNETILAGAKSVTLSFEIINRLLYHPLTDWSVETFVLDWKKVYGEGKSFIRR